MALDTGCYIVASYRRTKRKISTMTEMTNENAPTPSIWTEGDGIIRFRVRCDFDGNSYPADAFFDDPKTQSIAARFVRGDTREIAVLKGTLFDDRNRTGKNVQAEAIRCGLRFPSIDGCAPYPQYKEVAPESWTGS